MGSHTTRTEVCIFECLHSECTAATRRGRRAIVVSLKRTAVRRPAYESSLADIYLMIWPSRPLPYAVSLIVPKIRHGVVVSCRATLPPHRSILPRTPHNLQALQVQVVGRLHLSFSSTCLHRAMAPPFLWTVRNVDNLSVAASI